MIDEETCFRAAQAKDPRFDGRFFTAVTTTGIYCRPSCPAMTPRREHMVFYPSAAGAQSAGFRACKRCRPDAAPGSPEWNLRADLVGRAMRLIADGFVDREGIGGLASRLGYSSRQLHRQLRAELGASPIELARAQRAETARLLLESSALTISSVAFAAGFASIRQFNDTIRAIYACTPSELRALAKTRRPHGGGAALSLRLAYRAPIELEPLLDFLGQRAVPGVEERVGGTYRRVLDLPHATAIVHLSAGPEGGRAHYVNAQLQLGDLRDLTAAVGRCRRLLDLDADPETIRSALGEDELLAPLVGTHPGRRVPGAVDPCELAVRAVLGQQVSVAGARTLAGRLADAHGARLGTENEDGTLCVAFPRVEVLAGLDPATLPLPTSRGRALVGLCEALASGKVVLDPGSDRDEVERELLELPGIGPWTTAYIRMRALSDPDAFLSSDLGLRRALERLGMPGDPAAALARAEAWRPWRAYALQHLWGSLATGSGAVPTVPAPSSRTTSTRASTSTRATTTRSTT